MHRFFLPPEAIHHDRIRFPDTAYRQLHNVLRIKPGEQVIVLDNRGSQFQLQMDVISPQEVSGLVLAKSPANGEPSIHLRLFFSITQREKVEWILQKCTEIGVTAFFPFVSTYSLAREKGMDVSRLRRWEKIIQEAAEQCGRGRLPVLNGVATLREAVAKVSHRRDFNLLAWESEKDLHLHSLMNELMPRLEPGRTVNIFIGPEGGFAEGEVELMKKAGFTSFSLGKRIYRVETAAMAACLLVLYELDSAFLEKPVGQQIL